MRKRTGVGGYKYFPDYHTRNLVDFLVKIGASKNGRLYGKNYGKNCVWTSSARSF